MTVSDRDALVALHHRYADAVRAGIDAGADAWASTWVADATWHLPGRTANGRDEIAALWRTSMAKQVHVVQLYLSSTFDIDGDEATGRVQVVELVSSVDGTQGTLAGHYDDTYRRTADGWRFASRALTIYYRGASDLTGTFA